jgi:hypothetical protein
MKYNTTFLNQHDKNRADLDVNTKLKSRIGNYNVLVTVTY